VIDRVQVVQAGERRVQRAGEQQPASQVDVYLTEDQAQRFALFGERDIWPVFAEHGQYGTVESFSSSLANAYVMCTNGERKHLPVFLLKAVESAELQEAQYDDARNGRRCVALELGTVLSLICEAWYLRSLLGKPAEELDVVLAKDATR